MKHPYQTFVQDFVRVLEEAKTLPCGGFPAAPRPEIPGNAPRALVFSPHPDDESIVGALPLRLMRELRHRVIVVSVTQGSREDRRAARLEEQRGACAFLGFGLVDAGLEGITPEAGRRHPMAWAGAVNAIARILEDTRPRTVFVPHAHDANGTHQGTHLVVLDALARIPDFRCLVVETEFWAPLEEPNLMVECAPRDLADLVAAISFHRGEVARNPYHLRLPSWMSDNVRRGGERVGGQGGAAPDFPFAVLYRLRRWNGAGLEPVLPEGRIVPANGGLEDLFG